MCVWTEISCRASGTVEGGREGERERGRVQPKVAQHSSLNQNGRKLRQQENKNEKKVLKAKSVTTEGAANKNN